MNYYIDVHNILTFHSEIKTLTAWRNNP